VADGNILMGVIGRPHGVRGLVRVQSYTEEAAGLSRYNPLLDERGRTWTLAWKGEGVAELRDAQGVAVADRTAAEKLVNLRLYAPRDRMPPTDADDYYIADLIGLRAVDAGGAELGRVTAVHDYGAGTSLEIMSQGAALLVPFTRAVVPVVDVAGGRITVRQPEEIEVRELATGEPAA
jgi:16S rRNA processing protein RimM